MHLQQLCEKFLFIRNGNISSLQPSLSQIYIRMLFLKLI